MSEPMQLPPPRPRDDERAAARDRLGAAVRDFTDAVMRTGATADEIEAVTASVEEATATLTARPPQYRPHDNPFHPLSLVGGSEHPIAPQLRLERTAEGIAGSVRLGHSFEGGPDLAHGGILALLFDHAMGATVYVAGHVAMTRTLDVAYAAPTPLGTELHVSAWVERVDGRKIHAAAELRSGDTVTATATAVFVALTSDNVARIFAR